MKPNKLPLKILKNHIRQLKDKYSLRIKWGSSNPHYDAISNIVYLPYIKSSTDYVLCLHEIGHSQTPEILNITKRFVDILNMSVEFRDLKEKTLIGKEENDGIKDLLDKTYYSVKNINDKIGSPKWIWMLESKAWKFAYDNSLVWNPKCYTSLLNKMDSYWKLKTKFSSRYLYDKFYIKYIDPIFAE